MQTNTAISHIKTLIKVARPQEHEARSASGATAHRRKTFMSEQRMKLIDETFTDINGRKFRRNTVRSNGDGSFQTLVISIL